MPKTIAQLVAVFLLVVQGIAAFGPGRVLCVPIEGEVARTQADAADHGPCEVHSPSHVLPGEAAKGESCDDHEHGVVLALLHTHEDCGCHVHVPVRGDDTTPTTPRDRTGDARQLFAPVVVALLANWDWSSACVRTAEGHPPDRLASGQLRALKSTRLRI